MRLWFTSHFVFLLQATTGTAILEDLKGAVVLIAGGSLRVNKELLDVCKESVRYVYMPGTGIDHIDVEECKQRGVIVSNCVSKNATSVAQGTIMLILTAMRKLIPALEATKKGILGEPVGDALTDKVVGLIGFGAIGKKLKGILESSFEAKCLYTNSKSSRQDLETLLQESDVISIVCPLNKDTRNLIGKQELALVKKTCILVNAARAPIVNREALLDSLRDHRIAQYVSDVAWTEPIDPKDEILTFDNVLITPHILSSTIDHFKMTSQYCADNLLKILVEKKPEEVVMRVG